jgi:chromate transporter
VRANFGLCAWQLSSISEWRLQQSPSSQRFLRENRQLNDIGSPWEVFRVFSRLGLTSFGGPIAHIGYYREEIVVRRQWLDDSTYTDLVALCQFLPGPASSQVAVSLGLVRAGYLGALAAWIGFTLPSATLMTAFAFGANALGGEIGSGVIHGLKLVAVAIVAQAVWGMARSLCPDRQRASIAAIAVLMMIIGTSFAAQVSTIVMGGIVGFWLCRTSAPSLAASLGAPVSRRAGAISLAIFFGLLIALPALSRSSQSISLFNAFYRSGALVFGGGHVVLPLLSEAFVTTGWVSQDAFLSGYGAAQSMPGPLFTFAAYLGAIANTSPNPWAGAAVGIIGIFLPGILLLFGTLPFWDVFRRCVSAQAVMRGINAAVVGLLGAALYNPLWISSMKTSGDVAIALVGFVLLTVWRTPPFIVVALGALGGVAMSAAVRL